MRQRLEIIDQTMVRVRFLLWLNYEYDLQIKRDVNMNERFNAHHRHIQRILHPSQVKAAKSCESCISRPVDFIKRSLLYHTLDEKIRGRRFDRADTNSKCKWMFNGYFRKILPHEYRCYLWPVSIYGVPLPPTMHARWPRTDSTMAWMARQMKERAVGWPTK